VLGVEPQLADVEQAAAAVRTALQAQGFEVAGSYAPYPNAVVIIVTSEALKANAAKSDFGGVRRSHARCRDEGEGQGPGVLYQSSLPGRRLPDEGQP